VEGLALEVDDAIVGDKSCQSSLLQLIEDLPVCVKAVKLTNFGAFESEAAIQLPASVEILAIAGSAWTDADRARLLNDRARLAELRLNACDGQAAAAWTTAMGNGTNSITRLSICAIESAEGESGRPWAEIVLQLLGNPRMTELELSAEFKASFDDDAVVAAIERNRNLQTIDVGSGEGELAPRVQAILARNRMERATAAQLTPTLLPERTPETSDADRSERSWDRRWPGPITLSQVKDVLVSMGLGSDKIAGLKEFQYSKAFEKNAEYFEFKTEPSIEETAYQAGAKLGPLGWELLADHYRRKNGADIEFPKLADGTPARDHQFARHVRKFIEPLQAKQGDVRRAFLLQDDYGTHVIPVIFIKEREKQTMLVADSLGSRDCDIAYSIDRALSGSEMNVVVYRVEEGRQRDGFSCYLDSVKLAALMVGRDRTHDGLADGFIVPLVGEELALSSRKSKHWDNVKAVRLPPEIVVRLAQRSEFSRAQVAPEMKSRKLRGDRKHRTYEGFRTEHAAVFKQTTPDRPNSDAMEKADYVRRKGIESTRVVQAEFYNKQLTECAGVDWGESQQLQFVKLLIEKAKAIDRAAH
jgi:hypothetical protein